VCARVALVVGLMVAASAAHAQLAASAATLTFGSTTVGASNPNSNPVSSTITNGSAAVVTISGIAKSGTNASEFNATGTCVNATPVQLAAGASCTLGAIFAPAAVGTRTATLTVQSDAATNPAIALSGTAAVSSSATVALSRTTIAFPTQTIATTSAAQDVSVRNTGTAALTITQVESTPSPEFSSSSTCVGTLIPGGSCSIVLVFTPSAAGLRTGSVMITANTGPATVALSGNSVLTPTPIVTLTETSLELTSVQVGSAPSTKSMQIANSGNAPLEISAVAVQGPDARDFALGGATTCKAGTLAALAECRLEVEFRPQGAGSKSAAVAIAHNASGGSTVVALAASATAAPTTSSAVPPGKEGGAGALSLVPFVLLVALGVAGARRPRPR
jgi:hypothetical protein